MPKTSIAKLLERVRQCRICEPSLEHGVRPVLQMTGKARILIAGQAPGRRVHESGIPFDDPSGDRLRDWMRVSRKDFYDPKKVAILPMGFCYPGKGRSGDLAPRKECAPEWRDELMAQLTSVQLTLVIGQYAAKWHLESGTTKLTDLVKSWQDFAPDRIPLPHPSPRNNIWLAKNPWFESDVLPSLKSRVATALG